MLIDEPENPENDTVFVQEITPTLTKSLTTEDLSNFLTGYMTDAENMPDDGPGLLTNVLLTMETHKNAIRALNESFTDAADGIIVLTNPEYRLMLVQISETEVPASEVFDEHGAYI